MHSARSIELSTAMLTSVYKFQLASQRIVHERIVHQLVRFFKNWRKNMHDKKNSEYKGKKCFFTTNSSTIFTVHCQHPHHLPALFLHHQPLVALINKSQENNFIKYSPSQTDLKQYRVAQRKSYTPQRKSYNLIIHFSFLFLNSLFSLRIIINRVGGHNGNA